MHRLIIILCITLLFSDLYAQRKNSFYLQNKVSNRFVVNDTISTSREFDIFDTKNEISGLAYSGDIKLHSDTSLVRIILVDTNRNEYLIYETYPLLADSNQISVEETAEETFFLDNIVPDVIKIFIIDASVYIKEFKVSQKDEYNPTIKAAGIKQQNAFKIDQINRNLRRTGQYWVAGETSVSSLTYSEKLAMFGGRVPNLQGFEFYKGGIYVLPTALENDRSVGDEQHTSQEITESPYVEEFSWRNRHGQDWITPVKSQGMCGACWAFASTGATELMVNIYFNQHLDLDLSEQDLISCSGCGNCSGGDTYQSVDYIIDSGIVNEACFPYSGLDLPCNNRCEFPGERIHASSTNTFYSEYREDDVKSTIIRGASAAGIGFWQHAMTLVGYKVLQEGDSINLNYHGTLSWKVIPEGDILIGQTAWLFKNSWGEMHGDEGYVYVIGDFMVHSLDGPVYSSNYTDNDILCVDNDGDGYYSWGTGPKPSHCPSCPDEPDGDDSNKCRGPMDAFGQIQNTVPDPEVIDDTLLYSWEEIPELWAEGENIKWYQDYQQTRLLNSGNIFIPDITDPGIHLFYVTQQISECVSEPARIKLTVEARPDPPIVEDVTVEYGDTAVLYADGQNIKWYTGDDTIQDTRDEQYYKTIRTRNNMRWMAENLNFNTPSASLYYDQDSITYADDYGRLYSWRTAMDACPAGWHLPDSIEWMDLINLLGGNHIAGMKLKETGTAHWIEPNKDATDEINFRALPGGRREQNIGPYHYFLYIGELGYCWTSTQATGQRAYANKMPSNTASTSLMPYDTTFYFSVRCVQKPNPIALGSHFNPPCTEPGTYQFHVTQTVAERESYSTVVTLTIIPEAPIVDDYISFCSGDTMPPIVAFGENIKWYDNTSVNAVPFHSGDTLDISHLPLGNPYADNYYFFVTQTIKGSESEKKLVHLKILKTPAEPSVSDVQSCAGKEFYFIRVYDKYENDWYADSLLSTHLQRGDCFLPEQREPGIYNYYVTATNDVCTGPASEVTFEVKPQPGKPDSNNDSVCENDSVPPLTVMGENITWYYPQPDTLVDSRDGQVYKTVKIGDQVWMAENLNYYTPSGSWYYDNDSISYAETFGRLYSITITRNLCPSGWHLPSWAEWRDLSDYLGGQSIAGGKLKEVGTEHWISPNTGGTNISGFNGLPGGIKQGMEFNDIGKKAYFWMPGIWGEAPCKILSYENDDIVQDDRYWADDAISVRCISDGRTVIAQGSDLYLTESLPGVYQYLVTQTIDDCESPLDTVTLTINQVPPAPIVADTSMCQGEEVPDLFAVGENIRWYSDAGLTTLIYSGNSFPAGQIHPGVYTYYTTQTVANCQSSVDSVDLQIYESPVIDLGSDTTILIDQEIALDIGISDYLYAWSDGSDLPQCKISGPEIGPGKHTYWVAVTDGNLCTASDSIVITVIDPTNTTIINGGHPILIFPNPSKDLITIQTGKSGKYGFEITSLSGRIESIGYWTGNHLELDLSSYQKGIYFITISSKDFVTTRKIIKL